jgi:hypothetical protein
MATIPPSLNPKVIARLGEEIYSHKYKAEYEVAHWGKFVAINVRTGSATIGETPEEALEHAKAADPHGLFHLVRAGFPSAFTASYAFDQSNGKSGSDWIFG